MFQSQPSSPNFPSLEEEILELWKTNDVYNQSLLKRKNAEPFIFYEGPPTANGMPHPGHCLTRAIKDLFPRYRTMRGYYCERKAGWDTHGLPVEVEVCKELGIHSKDEIEDFGVEPFIQKCQQSVWRYMQEWEELTQRLGFWLHLEDAYVTYHQSYVESVWWSLKELFDRGLLYRGHKIVWWWAQGGTALSAGEVGQGYREVADPSVFVEFPLVDQPETSLLVWTTTPWTLPSNQFAAVNPELSYALVKDEESGRYLYVARELMETIADKAKKELVLVSEVSGRELIGKRYLPPFDYFYCELGESKGQLKSGGTEHLAWRVVEADFVTTDSGTGIVHQAPAFGEVDYEVLIDEQERFEDGQGPDLICAVGPDGRFTEVAPQYQGQWVKDADKAISRELRDRGRLFLLEQYLHDYPFCWRADEDPLIQYPRESWFIRTTSYKDAMLENNQQINWLPEHIKEGRFGNFLESNVDWALSRERFWGTPLPIWVCSETGQMEAVGDYDELIGKPDVTGTEVWEAAKAANPELVDDLKVHKPYIDAITYQSPFTESGRMERVPEVIDCWYDSGAMPFAQWGYPKENRERFESSFPADFISEAIDQTRGWFYSQLAISTMLFGKDGNSGIAEEYPHPYKNCVVLGLMLGEDGRKMSKSKRNYREPNEIFDKYGADALRWYFFANQAPWTPIRYKEQSIKDSIPEFMLRLWNVFSFFTIYANIDGFEPEALLDGDVGELTPSDFEKAKSYRAVSERSELDRWILGELSETVAVTISCMDAYDNYAAANRINSFVDALSNWYVRRSRSRFWSDATDGVEKRDAYWTLYECLVTLSKLIAPFTPFFADRMWQSLAGIFGDRAPVSVHLCDYPEMTGSVFDDALSSQMSLLREIASLGRSARMNEKLKVRQPLQRMEVVLTDASQVNWLESHDDILRDEVNIKEIAYTLEAEEFIEYQVVPNFKALGPRVGKLMPRVKAWLEAASGDDLLKEMETAGAIEFEIDGETVSLTSDEVEVRLSAKEGWAAAQGQQCVVVLSTELNEELIAEGKARDLIRYIQDIRKEIGCEFTDRIEVQVGSADASVAGVVEGFGDVIAAEALISSLVASSEVDENDHVRSLGESEISLRVRICTS